MIASPPRATIRLTGYAHALAAIAALIPLLSLIGWKFDGQLPEPLAPRSLVMHPLTAVSLVLASISLLLFGVQRGRRRSSWAPWAGRGVALVVCAIGFVASIQTALGLRFAIDHLLFGAKLEARLGPFATMHINTSANLVLVGMALLFLQVRKRRRSIWATAFAAFSGLEALLGVIVYLHRAQSGTGVPVALPTAAAFLAVNASIIYYQIDRGAYAFLTGASSTGRMARRLLLAGIFVPSVLGWLRIEGERRGYYGAEVGVVFLIMLVIVIFTALVCGSARSISRANADRSAAELRLQRAHDDLEMTEARLHAIVDGAPSVIYVEDLDGRFILVNESFASLLGSPKDEIVGRAGHDFFPKDLADESRRHDLVVLESGAAEEREATLERPDGLHTFASSKFPLRDARGATYALCAVATDITELKRASEALQAAKEEAERANLAKSDFLSRMSHELRTPMNAILGFAQLLEFDELDADQREAVTLIMDGGRHLLNLINEILDISRIEAGHISLAPEPVGIADALRETIDLVGPLATATGIRLGPAPVCSSFVCADRQRLKQVMLNLISNAIKYNRPGGSVTFSCREADARLRIAITDTGRGIPPAQMAQLFVPFERLGAEQGPVEGTGLGLALAKRLVEAMEGTLGIESVVEKGTTFWVEFPVVQSPLLVAETPVDPGAAGVAGFGPQKTLLYIEDNRSNLRLIQRVLALRPGLSLMTADDGLDGLRIAHEFRPDLILLDLNLPGLHGHEVLLRLRADPECASIPVIVVSADATLGQIERLKDLGACEYLTKPLDVNKFLEVVDSALGGATSAQALRAVAAH